MAIRFFSSAKSARPVTWCGFPRSTAICKVLETKFREDSTVSFKRPEGEFYMLFDAGPGQSFDVDYKDIQ